MKKMFFAAVAALAMISVSNVFAMNNAQVANNMTQVNDTVDSAVVNPTTPADTTVAPADTTATPTVDTTNVAK